jgi:hypothetical protein
MAARVDRAAPLAKAIPTVASVVLASALAPWACDADGEPAGGDPRFDAAVPCFANPFDASTIDLPARDAGVGTDFDGLYRDFFGPGVPSSCSRESYCHGTPAGRGAITSGGYVCPDEAGGGAAACKSSMLSHLVIVGQIADPDDSALVQILRRREGDCTVGRMPYDSDFTFTPAELDRIRGWIRSELDASIPADAGGE